MTHVNVLKMIVFIPQRDTADGIIRKGVVGLVE